jgi:DNA-binding transcriptional regulator YiaG
MKKKSEVRRKKEEIKHDAEAMKSARLRLRLSQVEFAILLGVHPVTVSKWERGEAEPSVWHYLVATTLTPNGCNPSLLLQKIGPVGTLAFCLKHLI